MTSIRNRSQLTTDIIKCISFVSSSIEDSNNLKKHGLHLGACRKLDDALSKVESVLKISPQSYKKADHDLKIASKELLLYIYKIEKAWDSNSSCY